MNRLYAILLSAAFILAGCSIRTETSKNTSDTSSSLIWYMPSNSDYIDTSTVNDAVNEYIHNTYPDISIELKFINMNEYKQKLSIYINAGEQADIVWTNDTLFPYINYSVDNIHKYLNTPIKLFSPHIDKRLSLDKPEMYRIHDKSYFIPTIEKCDGLIPFIKIPSECAEYFNTERLVKAVNNSNAASEELFTVINDYLDRLNSNGMVFDGVDFTAISDIFPLIGYETFISTSNLIGYRINDPMHKAVDMLNTVSTQLSYENYKNWYNNGYIRDDISITYKQNSNSVYKYSLSGAWGYKKNGKYYILSDITDDNCIYIAVDKYYHPAKLFSYSSLIIPTASKHTEQAIKILDLCYSDPELYNMITFGIEGTHYNTDNGTASICKTDYRCYTNIIPGSDGILSKVSSGNVICADMQNSTDSAGMYIPSSSSEFRALLFEYVNKYHVENYTLSLPDNNSSNINQLLHLYNSDGGNNRSL